MPVLIRGRGIGPGTSREPLPDVDTSTGRGFIWKREPGEGCVLAEFRGVWSVATSCSGGRHMVWFVGVVDAELDEICTGK